MIVKTGRKAALNYLKEASVTQLKIGLFKNDWAEDNITTVLSDLEEADFVGYARKSGVSFPDVAINGDDDGETLSPILTWTAGELVEPATLYGIFVTVYDPVEEEEVLMWYDKFAATTTLVLEGEVVQKRIKFLDTNYAPE